MDFFEKVINVDETEKIGLLGMTDEFFSIYVSKLFNKTKKGILVLTSNLYEANKLFFSIKKYSDNFDGGIEDGTRLIGSRNIR